MNLQTSIMNIKYDNIVYMFEATQNRTPTDNELVDIAEAIDWQWEVIIADAIHKILQ